MNKEKLLIEIGDLNDLHNKFCHAAMGLVEKPFDTITVCLTIEKDGRCNVNIDTVFFGREVLNDLSEEEQAKVRYFSAFSKFYHKLMKENSVQGVRYVISVRGHNSSAYTYQYSCYKDAQEWEELHHINPN